jgi:hypothetical protein
MSNICEIPTLKELTFYLQSEGAGSHVVLGVTLEESEKSDKLELKKFLKSKYSSYPHIKFAYFCAKVSDLGKLKTILRTDKSKYPYLYYIYNTTTICAIVNNTITDTMEESFVMMKEHYNVKKKNVSSKINNIDENKINDQEDDFDNINIDNINDHDINDINDNDINDMSNNISDNEEIIENDVNKKQNINKQDSGSNSNLLLDMKEKLEINQKKYLLEQKKTLDKIFLFKKHAGKYNQIFLEDMQERKQKEIEEKIAENTQINKSSKKYEEPVRNNGRRKR